MTTTTTTISYAQFVSFFGERLEAVRMDLKESWKLYQEKGEAEFLKELHEQEAFREFCKEYYDYMRERWNACSASMWESFEEFRTKYKSDSDRYWAYLEKC